MPPDFVVVLPPDSALEQLEDFLERALRGPNAAKARVHILDLVNRHACEAVEAALRPYPVPGGAEAGEREPA